MRRSAAPSQSGGLAKKQKFVSPAHTSRSAPVSALSPKIPVTQSTKNFTTNSSGGLSLFKNVIKAAEKKEVSDSKLSRPNSDSLLQKQLTGPNDILFKTDSHQESQKRNSSEIALLTRKPGQPLGNETNSLSEAKNIAKEGCERDVAFPSSVRNKIWDDVQIRPELPPVSDCKNPVGSVDSNSTKLLRENEEIHHQQTPGPKVASQTSQTSGYFSVVWCKLSKKKHKKWEGDAVLTTSGRSATLYDMEGKIIGRGSGYKLAQLTSLGEDETLVVGGKEILVMSLMTEDQFKSGKCFTSAGNSTDPISSSDVKKGPFRQQGMSKPFTSPLLTQGQRCHQANINSDTSDKLVAAPKFDPNLPGALVMPRPNPDHQWQHNKHGLVVVDVVLDPYLSNYLRNHQKAGVVFLYECVMGMRDHGGQGAILADDMGLGKTLQCICLIWTLLKQGPYGGKPVAKKILIITPGSLVKNWFLEFKKWLGTERLSVYAVSADKKADDFVKSSIHPVLVISYEMFVRCHDLIKEVPFDLIICDEGHRLKNTAIKTTMLIMSLPCKKRIVLTGTPVQNDLQEFFSIVEFCNPGILGSSTAFRRVYEDPIVASRQPRAAPEQQELGTERAEELTRLTQMFVLRRTQEINNDYLPPKVELVLFCQPSSLQLLLYRQLICSGAIRRCLNGNLAGSPHLICIGALKQLCNHPGLVYRKAAEAQMRQNKAQASLSADQNCSDSLEDSIFDGLLSYFPDTFDPNTVSEADSGKLDVLSGLLSSIWGHSPSDKVVLVSNHTKTLDFLQVFCDLCGYTYLRLDGQTPTAHRQDIVSRFNCKTSLHRIFLLSSKAGGVGLNLIGASRLVLYDIDWNPANDLQAMARVWRDGQRGKVHIYRLLTTGTIEEKIYQRQITKQGLSGAVMDLSNKNNVQFSVEDLKNLFSLNVKTDCETHSMLACCCQGDPTYIHDIPDTTVVEDDRPCQLGKSVGAKKKSKASNLTMAELLHWKHWKGEFVYNVKGWCLDEVGPNLSFIFWHETNTD